MTRGGKPSEQGGGTRYGTAGASCPPEPAPGTQGGHRGCLPPALLLLPPSICFQRWLSLGEEPGAVLWAKASPPNQYRI